MRVPEIREDRPWLQGANAFIQDRLWPTVLAEQESYPGRVRFDGRRSYRNGLVFFVSIGVVMFGSPVLLGGWGILISFATLPVVFVGAVIANIFYARRISRRAESDALALAAEKRLVAMVADHMGFDFAANPPASASDPVQADLDAVGLFATGGGYAAFWTDHLVRRDDRHGLELFDLVFGPDSRASPVSPFHGLVLVLRVDDRVVDCEIVGYGRAEVVAGIHLRMPDLDDTLPSGFQKVRLESNSFLRRFDLRATDQVMSRYLLTPAVMAALDDVAAIVNAPLVHLVFRGGRLLLLLSCRDDPLEFGDGTVLASPAAVERLFAEFSAILDLSARLREGLGKAAIGDTTPEQPSLRLSILSEG